MINIIQNAPQTIASAAPVNSASIPLTRATGYCIVAAITVNTPVAATFTANSGTSIFTATAHGFLTGLALQVSNSGGALPTGLAGVTTYYVIRIDANTFKLATTLANAQAGTNLTVSSNGTGTQTATPVALSAGAVSLVGSLDGVTYVTIASSSQNVTATANFMWNVANPFYQWVQVAYTLTAGQFTSVQTACVKGL